MLRTPFVERRMMRSGFSLLFAVVNIAAAEPAAPLRMQTVQLQPANQADTAPARKMFPNVHTLSVRPGYPGEPRDASGRPLFTPRISDGSALDVDPGMVGTLRVGLTPAATRSPDRHAIRTIRIPAQAVPQDAIEASVARQGATPTIREP
jgi:hypothetical protein